MNETEQQLMSELLDSFKNFLNEPTGDSRARVYSMLLEYQSRYPHEVGYVVTKLQVGITKVNTTTVDV